MKRSFFSVIIVLFAAIIANPVAAQDQQSDEGSLLPEIDPQDIEIRSQFKARFPGLRRQPILGFNPEPRVYQIDPNRIPFMESPEQVVADLPVSDLSRPDPPAYTPMHYSSDLNAFTRAGIGSYLTPEVQFWGVSRISNKSYIGGDLDYNSSDGHLDNQASSFRFLEANGEYAIKLNSKSRLGLEGGFQNSFNHMPDIGVNPASDDARKRFGGFNFGANFEHHKNSVTGWNIQGNMRYFQAELDNAGSFLNGESEEHVYNGSISRRWAGAKVNETFTIKAGAKGGSFDNSGFADSWLTGRAGVSYERLFNYSTNVSVDASAYYTMNQFEDKIYVGPSLTVEHPLMEILTLTLKAEGQPYLRTVEQLHSANRFMGVSSTLRHSYRMSGSAEASLDFDTIGSLKFGVQYEDISNYPMMVRQSNGRFYAPDYTDVYKVSAYLGATHQVVPEKFWLDGKLYLQSPKIKGGDRMPYEEKIGVNTGIHFRPFSRLSIETWADYVGSRRTFQTDEKLDGFLLLGGTVDVQITDRIGAYAKLVNALDQQYQVWQGYVERPFQAYGGVTIKL